MIFKTHELPQEYKATKSAKMILTICGVILTFLFIFITIVFTIEIHDFISPFCSILLPYILLGFILAIILHDMKKAYVEITDEKITVVDYYFGVKREKVFSLKDIVYIEKTSGYSMKVRGYRFSGRGFYGLKYFVFRGSKNKYMFKLICSNETQNHIEKLFEIQDT